MSQSPTPPRADPVPDTPIWFKVDLFVAPSDHSAFVANKFLAPLESVAGKLRSRLKSELFHHIDLINRDVFDVDDFLLDTVKEVVEDVKGFLFAATAASRYLSKMLEDVAKAVVIMEVMELLFDAVDVINTLDPIKRKENEKSVGEIQIVLLGEIAKEMSDLKHHSNEAMNVQIIKDVKNRMQDCYILLNDRLRQCFENSLKHRDETAINNCVCAYRQINDISAAVEIFRTIIVAPSFQKIQVDNGASSDELEEDSSFKLQEVIGQFQMDTVYETSSDELVEDSSHQLELVLGQFRMDIVYETSSDELVEDSSDELAEDSSDELQEDSSHQLELVLGQFQMDIVYETSSDEPVEDSSDELEEDSSDELQEDSSHQLELVPGQFQMDIFYETSSDEPVEDSSDELEEDSSDELEEDSSHQLEEGVGQFQMDFVYETSSDELVGDSSDEPVEDSSDELEEDYSQQPELVLGQSQMDIVYKTSSDEPVEDSSGELEEDSSDELEELFPKIIKCIKEDCIFFLEKLSSGFHDFDFVANSILIEVLHVIKMRKPKPFSTDRPTKFLHYHNSILTLLAFLGGYCLSGSALCELRSEAVYTDFMQQWNVRVYFSSRFQEITRSLDSALTGNVIPVDDNGKFRSRYINLICLGLLSGEGDGVHANTALSTDRAFAAYLEDLIYVIHDIDYIVSKLTGANFEDALQDLGRISDDYSAVTKEIWKYRSSLSQWLPAVIETLIKAITTESVVAFKDLKVHETNIRREYKKRFRRYPTVSSSYVSRVLLPLKTFVEGEHINLLDKRILNEILLGVAEKISRRYCWMAKSVINVMAQQDVILPTSSDLVDEKITYVGWLSMQLFIDMMMFGNLLHALGIDVAEVQSYGVLRGHITEFLQFNP